MWDQSYHRKSISCILPERITTEQGPEPEHELFLIKGTLKSAGE
jgi:hypothetical protein